MSGKILIIEEDALLLEVLQTNLSDEGFQVEVTNDILKARDLIEKQRFDVLVTNLNMPSFKGLDLVRSVKKDRPEMPVIILFAKSTLEEAIDAVNLNIFRYIKLPIENIGAFKDAVKQAIEQGKSNNLMPGREIENEIDYYRKCIIELYSLPDFGSIATGITHNLNSPLGGVIGYTQLAMMKNPKVKGLDLINQQAVKISKMLAAISEKGQSELTCKETDIDLNVLISKELEYLNYNLFFKHQVDKNLNLNDIPSMKGVYRDWAHILHHLIQNSVDAMYKTSNKTLTITTKSEGSDIHLILKDTGEGIPAENIDKIFNPGFSSKPFPWNAKDDEQTGFGLGLYIVKTLSEKYHARIQVKSELGEGTEVIIAIPVVKS